MEPITLLILVALYFWLRSRDRRTEAKQEVARPQHDVDSTDLSRAYWTFDFTEMSARWKSRSLGSPDTCRDYELRRIGISTWEVRLSFESWKAECAELKDDFDNRANNVWFTQADYEHRKAQLDGGPKWTRLEDGLAAKLENDYQRFLHARA